MKNHEGKYIGYLASLEGSNLIWSDDIEFIKKQWCFGMAIFESNGLDMTKLKEAFPEPPERGVILDYLSENLQVVHQNGVIIGKLKQQREVLTEKSTKKIQYVKHNT
jgi:hypothetical protein